MSGRADRQRHVRVRVTPRVIHPLGPVIAFYEALACADYIYKKINPDGTHSLKAPCDPQANVLPGRVWLARLQSIQRPAAGKGGRHLLPCVYISAEAACFFYDIHREALLCAAGHTGLIKVHWQSESQCSISLPPPDLHYAENTAVLLSFIYYRDTENSTRPDVWKSFHFICILMLICLFFFLHRTLSSFLMIYAIFSLLHHKCFKKKSAYSDSQISTESHMCTAAIQQVSGRKREWCCLMAAHQTWLPTESIWAIITAHC